MKIIKITDVNDSRLDIFYRKNEKQLYHGDNIFIAESELVINRALEVGFEPLSFLIQSSEETTYQALFSKIQNDFIVYEVSDEIFKQLKGFILIKGILASFKRKELLSFEDICRDSKRLVVLENVQNPTNIGAIIRNAVGLFADAILLTNDSCDPLYRRSIRVSMGNVFKINYTYVNTENYIKKLHELDFKTVALALRDDAVDIDNEELNNEEKLAIILGSEGYGLSDKTINDSDYVVKIKMNPDVDSLNVASASGIALWKLCLKRK